MDSLGPGGKASGPSAGREVARPPDWTEYLAFAEIRLGIPAERFFRLTPRLFDALRHQWEVQQRETFAMFASLRMELINRSFRHAEEPVQLSQLLPDAKSAVALPQRLTKKRRAEIADSFRRVMGLFAS